MLAPRARPVVAPLCALLLLAASAVTVRAGADPAADALVEEGVSLREKGRDEEALDRFRRAYALEPTARARAQIALAEQALGRWVEAERDLVAALSRSTDPWIAKNEAALRGALATIGRHVGEVLVVGGVAGAQVRVDGVPQGTLPLAAPLRLEAGTHTLEVEAPGHYPVSRPVTVDPDAPARVSVEMRARPAGAPDAPGIAPPATGAPPAAQGSPGTVQRIVGLSLAGASLVGVGIGIAGLAARGGAVSAYNADPTCPAIDAPQKPAQCQAHVDASRTWETAAIVGFVAGGTLLVAGAITFFTAPSAPSSPAPRASLSCSPALAGARCTLVF